MLLWGLAAILPALLPMMTVSPAAAAGSGGEVSVRQCADGRTVPQTETCLPPREAVVCPVGSILHRAPSAAHCERKSWAKQLFSTAPRVTAQATDAEEAQVLATETGDEAFKAQWGLGAVNAQWAYARGATGEGVTIGIIDSGMDHRHPAFAGDGPAFAVAGKVNRASILFYRNDSHATSNVGEGEFIGTAVGSLPLPTGSHLDYNLPGPGGTYPHRDDVCSGRGDAQECTTKTVEDAGGGFWRIPDSIDVEHGTSSAATAAGRRYAGSSVPHGVAYDASIWFVARNLTSPFPTLDADLRRLVGNVPVINLSFGRSDFISDPKFNDSTIFNDAVSSFRTVTAQAGTDADDRTILVWAAGNSNGIRCDAGDYKCVGGMFDADIPSLQAGAPYRIVGLRGHHLAVAAVRQDNPATSSTDEEGIADFSNRCGVLPAGWNVADHGRHYCLSAPGHNILTPLPNCPPGEACPHDRINGTSFAAPMVAGAVAVLIDFYTNEGNTRAVGNTAIAQRLLETANRRGIYAADCDGSTTGSGETLECTTYSTTYGAGLMDLKAATEPMGSAMMMTGSSLQGRSLALAQTRLYAGAAYGDSFQRAFAGTRVATFDDMLFPFWQPLASLVGSPQTESIHRHRARFAAPIAARALPGNLGDVRLGFESVPDSGPVFSGDDTAADYRPASLFFRRDSGSGGIFFGWRAADYSPLSLRESLPTPTSDDAFSHPFMAFADGGITAGFHLGAVTAAAFVDHEAASPVHGMVLDYALSPMLSAQAGMLSEARSALGLRPVGAFGELKRTHTAFTGLKLKAPVATGWSVLGHAHLGTARPDPDNAGLVKEVSPLLASAFSIGLAGRSVIAEEDGLTLSLSQPLRVESGRASLTVPIGRTPEGALLRRDVSVPLEPSGREVSLSAAWTAPLHQGIRLRFATGVSRHPGHNQAVSPAVHALADVAFRF